MPHKIEILAKDFYPRIDPLIIGIRAMFGCSIGGFPSKFLPHFAQVKGQRSCQLLETTLRLLKKRWHGWKQ